MKHIIALSIVLSLPTACGTTSNSNQSTLPSVYYNGGVAALNAYCSTVGTTDAELGPVCSDVLNAVNMSQPVAASALNYIISVLTKREARAAYDAKEIGVPNQCK